MNEWLEIANGAVARARARSRDGTPASFFEAIRQALASGGRMVAFFGLPDDPLLAASPDATRLVAVRRAGRRGEAACSPRRASGTASPRSTPEFPQVHRFEREIHEQWGVRARRAPVAEAGALPEAVPRAGRPQRGRCPQIGVTDFFRVGGREIHEVAVGPVHAGIIEPGHFRFQCHGEHVLPPRDRARLPAPRRRARARRRARTRARCHYVETLAGDTTRRPRARPTRACRRGAGRT